MITLHKFSWILLGFILCACTPNYYKKALQLAGANRSQLEQVVAHYKETGETQKVKAARFLIANMEGKQTVIYNDNTQYKQLVIALDSIYTAENKTPAARRKMQQYVETHPLYGAMHNDLEVISASYLIQQIDQAFDTWEHTGWHSQYSFDLFCQYLLPYKVVDNAPLEDWRTQAAAEADALDDSLQGIDNPMLLARRLIKNADITYFSEAPRVVPFPASFNQLKLFPYGDCLAMGNLGTFYARSRGIPSATDYNMAWANRSASHAWTVVVMPNGSQKTLTYYMDDYDDPLSHRDFELGIYFKVAKLYRFSYAVPRQNVAYKFKDKEAVHSKFIWSQDVTSLYQMPQFTARVTLAQPLSPQLVYLCTFNNADWVPVACAQRKGKKVDFPNMAVGVAPHAMNQQTPFVDAGEGIVFLPIQYNGETNIPVAPPFLLDTLGQQHQLIPSFSATQNLTITRKYPEAQEFRTQRELMAGLRLLASQNAAGGRTRELLTVGATLDSLYQPFTLSPGESFRYVKLEADSNLLHLAEVVFYDTNGNRLTPVAVDGIGEECVDDYILSYYQTDAPSLQILLDFGRPVQPSYVALAPRTDDNEIVPGFLYELQYWDNQWIPIAQKEANAHFLTFDNLPSNALFRLHCLSGGKEERPFTIQDGRPVWW